MTLLCDHLGLSHFPHHDNARDHLGPSLLPRCDVVLDDLGLTHFLHHNVVHDHPSLCPFPNLDVICDHPNIKVQGHGRLDSSPWRGDLP